MTSLGPFTVLPSILRCISLSLNGNNLMSNNQANISNKIVKGIITIAQSPKPMLNPRPAGSFKYLRAIALGGVPTGVAIPPMLAPIGIAMTRPILPLSSSGS